MRDLVLNVDVRPNTGSGGARATRREGLVPGILYGGDRGPVAISTSFKELKRAVMAGGIRSHVVQIAHKGETQPVLVRDIQFDPVSDEPVHFDLYRIEEGQVISVEVRVRFINEALSPGLKRGGALNVVRHLVPLDCPANAIPEDIEVDLAGLEIGDSVHISAVKLPEGVRPTIRGRDFTVATITGAGSALPEAAEEEAAPIETEVIKKGKAEEEGEGDKAEKSDKKAEKPERGDKKKD